MAVVYISKSQRAIGLFAGLTLIALGLVVTTKTLRYSGFVYIPVNPVGIALIAVGVFIFATGFFGCCGVRRTHYCAVVTCAVLLGTLLIVQVAAVILAVIFDAQVTTFVQSWLLSTMPDYRSAETVKASWDQLHRQFKCCGTINFTDWEVADLSPRDDDGVLSNSSSVRSSGGVHGNDESWSLSVPDSCCMDILEDVGCGWGVMNKAESRLNKIHTEGCVTKFLLWIEDNGTAIIVFFVCIVAVQTTGVLLTWSLARNIHSELTRYRRGRNDNDKPLL